MLHYMKYRLKMTLREKDNVFWAMAFPLLLLTLFRFSIAQTGNEDRMEPVPVGAVIAQENAAFEQFLEELDGEIIKLKVFRSTEDAETALNEKEITGIYRVGQKQSLVAAGEGIQVSILEGLLDSYEKNAYMIQEIAKERPEKLEGAAEGMKDGIPRIKEVGLGGRTLQNGVQFYFAGLAMACLYGCFSAFQSATELKANMEPVGARKCVSPARKLHLIISDLTVLICIHFTYMILLLLYMQFVLKAPLEGDWGRVLSVCFFGTVFGISAGILVGSISRLRRAVKMGILISGSLVLCFFSGLMVSGIKNLVEQVCPLLNRVNPATLIADAFYCIHIYDDPARFTRNLAALAVMALVCLVFSFLAVRRERYDSI